jgi:hypothetical protein
VNGHDGGALFSEIADDDKRLELIFMDYSRNVSIGQRRSFGFLKSSGFFRIDSGKKGVILIQSRYFRHIGSLTNRDAKRSVQ